VATPAPPAGEPSPISRNRIVDQSKTRVLAFINIVGAGMGSGPIEQNLADMEVKPTADAALKYKGLIVESRARTSPALNGRLTKKAEEVGRIAHIPVMVDFGSNVRAGRSLYDLLNKYFRPGDIPPHVWRPPWRARSGNQGTEQAMIDGRKRGVIFDVATAAAASSGPAPCL